jgi:hypothetical protein
MCLHTKWKKCDVGLHSWVLQGAPHKGKMTGGKEACIYITQITTKLCTFHFTMFKNKYLGLCVGEGGPLAAPKCTTAQISVLWLWRDHTFWCTTAAIGYVDNSCLLCSSTSHFCCLYSQHILNYVRYITSILNESTTFRNQTMRVLFIIYTALHVSAYRQAIIRCYLTIL